MVFMQYRVFFTRRSARNCVISTRQKEAAGFFTQETIKSLVLILSYSHHHLTSQPAVPETALKKRKRDEAWAAKKAAAAAEAKAHAEKNSKEIFKRA